MSLFNSICITALLVVAVSGCSDRSVGTVRQKSYPVADKTALLATIPAGSKPVIPRSGPAYHGATSALSEFVFSESGRGVFYTIEKDGLSCVVHNGAEGKPYKTLGVVVLSPDGSRIAYGALAEGKWHMVADGVDSGAYDTVKSPVFSPDSRHLAYQAMKGEKWYLVIDNRTNSGTKKRYLKQVFNGDSSRIAYIEQGDGDDRGRLDVSDLEFKQLRTVVPRGAMTLLCNADRTRVAAIIQDEGKQRVIDFDFDRPEDIRKGEMYDAIQDLTFGSDGVSPAYSAQRNGKRFMVLNNREEVFPDGAPVESPVVSPGAKSVGVLISAQNQSYLWQFFGDGGKKGNSYDGSAFLTYGKGEAYAFAANRGKDSFVVVNGKEGLAFDRVVSPRFSPDGKYLAYRARKDGKRFVVVADTSGNTIRRHPVYEQVYDVQFTADGRSVAYGVKDGQQLIWKVEAL